MYISPNIPFRNPKEMPGKATDLECLKNDAWLMDTEIRYHLQKRKGLWQLAMIYIAIQNPFKLLCRKIDSYPSEKRQKYLQKFYKEVSEKMLEEL